MSEIALLNPKQEAPIAKLMVTTTEETLRELEGLVTHTVLDREAYLLTMGKIAATRAVVEELRNIYRRSFKE